MSPSLPPADSLCWPVASMMGWTHSYCRVFHRLLAPQAGLYTVMAHANAVL